MTKKNKSSNPKKLAIAGFFAIFIALLFMISSVPAQAGTGHQQETGFTTSVNYIPNPTLNSNVSWSVFHNNWKTLEYSNGTGNKTLNAGLSTTYKDPISVNPTDIQSTYLTDSNSTGTPFNSGKLAKEGGTAGGSVQTTSYSNGIYSLTQNTSAASTEYEGWNLPGGLSDSVLPSNNMAYNWITISYSLSGPAMTGVHGSLVIWNETNNGASVPKATVYPGQSIWESAPLTAFKGANFNISVSTSFKPELELILPEHSSTTYTIKLNAFMITETPLYLGTNATGTVNTEKSPKFQSFSPDFSWQSVSNNGYTVAVSQETQNITISETSINNGAYTEEATYQGILKLPSEPDLSYSNSYISMKMNMTGKQFIVTNLNGVSYSSQIQTKTNGTFTFGSVNPNNANTVIIEVQYTTAQWTASSGAPSIWSIAGIEYYWYILLGAGLGLIGLGTGIKSHANSLRVGKR